jgi:hypothetical protein
MFMQTKTAQRFQPRYLRQLNAFLSIQKCASSFSRADLQKYYRQISRPFNLSRSRSGLAQSGGNFQSSPSHRIQSCWYATDPEEKADIFSSVSIDACPQGIQGDDCVTFKLWLKNCQRYGLNNCNDQLQGIQSGRKTLAEIIVEQDRLIADIAAQYRDSHSHSSYGDRQGVQDNAASINVEDPCAQGVQGEDCARFKLWIENCQRSGHHDCTQRFNSFKTGRKSLAEIFAEQDRVISEAATPAFQKAISQQRRKYSTSTRNHETKDGDKPESAKEAEETPLTQRQKLKRAVKEYGSTVIVFHVAISLASLGFFYLLVSSGIDVVGLLTKLEIGGTLLQNKLAAGTGTFVVAYAVHKVFAPVRIATTLTATPFIVRYLRQIGFLKVPQHSKSK